MKKLNSKALYKLCKKIKMKENIAPILQDSLQIVQQPKKVTKNMANKHTHIRSQSCPFQIMPLQAQMSIKKQQQKSIINRMSVSKGSQFTSVSVSNFKKKKHHKSTSSQLSLENKTVIIKQLPLQQISSILFRINDNNSNKSNNLVAKKSICHLKGERYTQMQLEHQIKKYKLKEQLQNMEKESANMNMKQKIISSMIMKCQIQRSQKGFQFS